LVASEPRISAAVFGLGAPLEEDETQRAYPASITIPLLFLPQWDDDLITRDGGIALWAASGSGADNSHQPRSAHRHPALRARLCV
jgi:hypothetical protein